MAVTIEGVLFYFVLLDAVMANVLAWFCAGWYKKRYKKLWKYLPVTKGWAAVYLVMALWVGWILLRVGALV